MAIYVGSVKMIFILTFVFFLFTSFHTRFLIIHLLHRLYVQGREKSVVGEVRSH